MDELIPTTDKRTAKIAKRVADRRRKAPGVTAKMVDGVGKLSIGKDDNPHDHLKLMAAMGTHDMDFLWPLLSQVGNAVSRTDGIDEASFQFAVGFIKSIKPKSEAEAMLAAQMAAVHICSMDASRRYLAATHLEAKDSAERALTKLTRTFALQMDTLKRYRAKAQQTVRVERVTVNEGGRAIVGDVTHGGRVGEKK